jgi:hypothetical protein
LPATAITGSTSVAYALAASGLFVALLAALLVCAGCQLAMAGVAASALCCSH